MLAFGDTNLHQRHVININYSLIAVNVLLLLLLLVFYGGND
jgi:uncharacterized integral membrane protein